MVATVKHSAAEINVLNDLKKLEAAYQLPEGHLMSYSPSRGIKLYGRVNISVLKQAISLKHYGKLKLAAIAPMLGFKSHTSVINAYCKGRIRQRVNDSEFAEAYSIITENKGV